MKYLELSFIFYIFAIRDKQRLANDAFLWELRFNEDLYISSTPSIFKKVFTVKIIM